MWWPIQLAVEVPTAIYGSRLRLLIIGAGQLSQLVARMPDDMVNDFALMVALKSAAFHVGAIGSGSIVQAGESD